MKIILNRITDWMLKHKENKMVIFIARILYFILDRYEKITKYFKKEVIVYAEHILRTDDELYPDTIKGFIVAKGMAHSFSGIPWEDIDRIIGELQKEDKPLMFEISHGGTMYQNIYLSRWHRKEMTRKLIELKEKEENK